MSGMGERGMVGFLLALLIGVVAGPRAMTAPAVVVSWATNLGWLQVGATDITIRDLRVGRHKFDIRFWREGERTEHEVLNGNASLVERCEMGVKAAQLKDHAEPI